MTVCKSDLSCSIWSIKVNQRSISVTILCCSAKGGSGNKVEEAVSIANQSIYGLSGAIVTRDFNKAIKVSEQMECGGFVINGASFFRSFEQPFGGWKYSGIGNEGIMTTLNEMSRMKTVILKNVTK